MASRSTVAAVVRDVPALNLIRATLSSESIEVLAAADEAAGWETIQVSHPDVILLEACFAGGLLERIAEWDPAAPVLVLTAAYDAETALAGIEHGAFDFLRLPLSADDLRERIGEVLRQATTRRETLELEERLRASLSFQGMVGRSPRMLAIFARIRRIAPHYRVGLISGATGTGKELVAHALHDLSPVAARRFAVCNCSAIVESLFESELFGHVRGAFTGANQDHIGLFEYAQGGTVFLDEIGDMPLAAQSKLLRVVQNQELQRVGSPEVRKVDVRVIAATNRDLAALVDRGLFREDLYYRLSMVELNLPGLAERKEDLPLLQRHLLDKFSLSFGKRITGITRRAQAALARHSWPGNIRELENVLGHACMMTESEFVDLRDLPDYLRDGSALSGARQNQLMPLAELESRYAQYVLERVGGNKLQAAQVLGISRATLYRILRESGGEPVKALTVLDRLAAPSPIQ